MAGETGSGGRRDAAFRTVPLTSMVPYFMIIPVMAGLEHTVGLCAPIECADIRSQVPEDMSPDETIFSN